MPEWTTCRRCGRQIHLVDDGWSEQEDTFLPDTCPAPGRTDGSFNHEPWPPRPDLSDPTAVEGWLDA